MSTCIFIGMGKVTFPVPEHFEALGHALAARGHQVHLFQHHHHPILERPGNPAYHYWPWRKGLRRAWDLVFLSKFVRRLRPDCIVDGHRASELLLVAGMIHGVRLRVRWHHILSQQTDLDSGLPSFKRGLQKRIWARFYGTACSHLVGVSSAAIQDLETTFHVPSPKCMLLLNSLKDPLKEGKIQDPLRGRPEERLVCAGGFRKSKGQDVLLHAGALIVRKFPELLIHFVGTGEQEENLKQMADQLGIARNVRFAGSVHHSDVLAFMKGASLTICPSRMDNLPTVVIESLAVGTPVIASRVGGIPDIFANGQGGYLVPAGDPEALAEKMLLLLVNEQIRSAMAVAARERFLDVFEQEKNIQNQAHWLDSLICRS